MCTSAVWSTNCLLSLLSTRKYWRNFGLFKLAFHYLHLLLCLYVCIQAQMCSWMCECVCLVCYNVFAYLTYAFRFLFFCTLRLFRGAN